MKARIKKTGEIIEVTRNTQGLYVDENRVGYSLKDLDFGNEEDKHWNNVRERAAIAAMQGTISVLSSNNRIPNQIAEFAVACADALIDKLKNK
jgi:hypothetical protein